ncbi:MAG: tetratricopeptide repeat protein [Isosphaeraceae bacterium]|nr:tetratricopeptide repeat protein [Isosphaeraceae bacterium]
MARSDADLAWSMYKQGRTEEAEPLARWALEVRSIRCGPESEPTAQSLYELALILDARSQFPEAEALLRRSIAAWEKHLGPYDLRVTFYLTELARVLTNQRKLDQAESVYRRILGRPERALPARHPYRITSLIGLGSVYTAKGEPIRARFQNAQVLPLLETLALSDDPEVALPLSHDVGQLKQAGRIVEATQLEDGARALLFQIDKGRYDQIRAVLRVVQAAGKPGQVVPSDPAR